MNGLLLIDKPAGVTSHDVVARVRRWAGTRKAGHTGTLDPAAEGLLVVCVGEAVKVVSLMDVCGKEYAARLRLGLTTDTQDLTGRVLAERDWRGVDEASIRAGFAAFQGTTDQLPPMFSAVKVGRRKLVDFARAGREVERKPRRVTVEFRDLKIALPEAEFVAAVSKGTYIRTLCHDIGERLGCGAVMAALRRTRVGPFDVRDAVRLDDLAQTQPGALRPMLEGLDHVPRITVSPAEEDRLRHGLGVPLRAAAPGAKLVALDQTGRLVAIAVQGEGIRPVRGFVEATED